MKISCFIFLLISLILILFFIVLLINMYVIKSNKNKIIDLDKANILENIDGILVLGAGIKNNKPSDMLRDRLLQAIKLYKNNVSSKIIMSGDHGSINYDEVNVMKEFAINNGILSEDIFMDHAGFSTYDSLYRLKEIFEAKKVIIVTQKYHLYRALFIAKNLGIEAYGVSADLMKYRNQKYREFREIIARNKDFFKCFIKPKPKFLGEKIPIKISNGDITNDKK